MSSWKRKRRNGKGKAPLPPRKVIESGRVNPWIQVIIREVVDTLLWWVSRKYRL